MKATTLLQRQHRRVEQLVTAVERERYVRLALLENLADDLCATLSIKEMLFYPAARDALGEACAEDRTRAIHDALQRCFDRAGDDDAFAVCLAALERAMRASFEDEEHQLYPRVERALGEGELERLGAQMNQLYREIVECDGDERVSSIGRPSRADWYRFETPHA